MSQETYLNFYVEKRTSDLPNALTRLVQLMGVNGPVSGTRYDPKTGDSTEFEKVELEKLPAMFDQEHNLFIELMSPPRSRAFADALEKEVGPKILGRHRPTEAVILLGPQRICDLNEAAESFVAAKPSLTVKLWGYEIPPHYEEFRAALPKLNCVAEFQNELALCLKQPVKLAVTVDY